MAAKKPFGNYSGKFKEFTSGDIVPIANLATGTPDGTKFIRDDGTLVTPAGGAGSLIVASSTITSGTTTRVLYDNAGVLGEYTITGTGTTVMMSVGPTISSGGLIITTGFLQPRGGISTTSIADDANLYSAPSNTGVRSTTANILIAGASGIGLRTIINGGAAASSYTPTVGDSYAGTLFGTSNVTISGSGTNSLFTNVAIKTMIVTTGAGTLTNSAQIYIEGASTNATNNYAIWSDAGNNRFDGNVGIGVVSPTSYLHLAAGTATVSTAPLKLTSGTLLTVTEAGAIEFDGTNLYLTLSNGGPRSQLNTDISTSIALNTLNYSFTFQY